MKQMGIITNNITGVFQRDVISGIEQVASAQGYAVKLFISADNPQYSTTMLSDFHALDGLLIIANAAQDDVLRALHQYHKPISLVSHQVAGTSIPMVMTNNVQGIAELVHHLVVRCSRRKLVFIRGLMDQNDGREREIAFRQELIRYDVQIPELHFLRGDFDPETASASVRALLDSGSEFDGIIACDYLMGAAAVNTLRAVGVRVPEDVSVVGYGDAPEAEAAGLTTVAANIVDLGACAARQLISQIRGLRISGVTVLSVGLVTRDTSGCA